MCNEAGRELEPHVALFLDRMRVVFRGVNDAVRRATEDAANRKLETLVAERVALFAIDHPTYATKEQTNILLRQIETQLDESPEAEAVRNAMVPLRRDHRLGEDPAQRVEDHHALLEDLRGLKHAFRAEVIRRAGPVEGGAAASAAEVKETGGNTRKRLRRAKTGAAARREESGASPGSKNGRADGPTRAATSRKKGSGGLVDGIVKTAAGADERSGGQ